MKIATAYLFLVLFLFSLMGSFFWGFTYSKINEENIFTKNNYTKELYTISLTPEMRTTLNNFYLNSGENEFSVCLVGYKEETKNEYLINGYDRYKQGDDVSVPIALCNFAGAVGSLHKHSPDIPYPSHRDEYTSFKEFNELGLKIHVIMYDLNKFTVLSPGNWFGINQEMN